MILKTQKSRMIAIVILIVIILGGVFGIKEMVFLRKAHSTFENYYAFRGCVQLLDRTDDYGDCKIASGQTIKIVKFQDRWYLDGDLPTCWLNICL